jgi:low affinity Fe/Cu permease
MLHRSLQLESHTRAEQPMHPPDLSAPSKGPEQSSTIQSVFRKVAHRTAAGVGSPWAFTTALAIILVWAATGPVFHFSDTWQLVINTGTTVVTFLMVFLIQSTQNRDATAIQLKLDELIRAVKSARNRLLDIEDLSDEELENLRQEFQRLGAGGPASDEPSGKGKRHRREKPPVP